MKNKAHSQYAVDNASLLYLSLIRKDHTNAFRFTMTLREDICPETLQLAVDRIYRRFPTVIAGFYPGFFHYFQVPAKVPPQVQPDPGCLITMTKQEIRQCAYRVLYSGKTVAIEAFHALTDGYGAITSFTTLVAEYLRLKHGIQIPIKNTLIDIRQSPSSSEVVDSYLEYEAGKPMLMPNRHAYQLPGAAPSGCGVLSSSYRVPVNSALEIARHYGVSLTALLSSIMAESIMEVQNNHLGARNAKPVRIMVPVDLRRMFPSHTLRNFILYALPTMEPRDCGQPFRELLSSFAAQLHTEVEKDRMASIMAYHVKAQHNWIFRHIPLVAKCAFMRFVYQFFGEVNSSVTVTNLGNVQLPEEMQSYVKNIEVILTPRRRSPYNCAVISYSGLLSINISRFSGDPELETVFFRKLSSVLQR